MRSLVEHVIVDVYRDGELLRLFHVKDMADFKLVIKLWHNLDDAYSRLGYDSSGKWKPFSEWMDDRGYPVLAFNLINL